MRRSLRNVLAAIIVTLGTSVAVMPSAVADTITAIQDTYIDTSAPSSNYGSRTTLKVDNSPVVTTYLQFNVQGWSVGSKARLQVYAETALSRGVDVRSVANNSWDEATMTASNAPPPGAVINSTPSLAADAWFTVDVSSAVTQNGLVTFALTTTSTTAVRLTSSEGANPPKLIVDDGTSTGHVDVSKTATGYQATSPAGAYTGTLKTVVEKAVSDLEAMGGGTVQFTSGTFDFRADYFKFYNLRNITFVGAGMDSTIIQNNNSSDSDTEPFNFSGAFSITIRDLTVRAGGSPRATSDALDFDQGNSVVVENVKVAQSRGRAIVFDGKNDSWTSTGNYVANCVIDGTSSDGIELLASTDNVIEGCVITNTGGHGIQMAKSSPTADQPNKKSSNNMVRNNVIDEAGQDGINIHGGDDNKILGNRITNSSNVSSGHSGIRLGSGDAASCDRTEVRGNVSTDNQATKTQRWGLLIATSLCAGTVVGNDNDFSGNLNGPVRDLGTGTVFE